MAICSPVAQGQTCNGCGIEPLEGQQFRREKFPFRRLRWYCANCHARLHRRINTALLVAVVLMGLAGFILQAVAPGSFLGEMFITIFLVEVFLAITIIPHEFGHAFAGRLCGFNVHRVVVGAGPNILVTRLFGFPTEFKLLPVGGFAYASPRDARWLRSKWLIFVAAGPFANILANFVVHFATGVPIWPPWGAGDSAVTKFMFANWVHLFVNLMPFVASTAYGKFPTDGLAMLQLIFLRKLPFVPAPGPSKWKRLIGWSIAIFLWLMACLCLVLAWFAFKDMQANWQIKLFLVALFGVMGLGLIRYGLRALQSSAGKQPETGQKNPMQSFQEEMVESARKHMLHSSWTEYMDHLRQEHWAAAETSLLQLSALEESAYVAFSTAEMRLKRQDYAGVIEALEKGEKLLGRRATIWARLQIVKVKTQSGDVAAAKERSQALLEGLTGANRLFALDHLACLPIMDQLKGFLDEAEAFSREASEMQPQNLTLKGTRGAILVELGRYEEGEKLLNEVYSKSKADIDKGISAFYLGFAAKARGEIEQAKSLGSKAKRLYPEKWLTRRVDAELLRNE